MAIKLGMEATLNYKVGGQDGAGSWLELTNTKDVTLSLEAGEADVTTRGNDGWRAIVATLKEASVEFEMVWDNRRRRVRRHQGRVPRQRHHRSPDPRRRQRRGPSGGLHDHLVLPFGGA